MNNSVSFSSGKENIPLWTRTARKIIRLKLLLPLARLLAPRAMPSAAPWMINPRVAFRP